MANNPPIRVALDFETRFPNASALATESAMNLVFTADLLVKQIAQLLEPYDLTPSSGLVLSMLADSEAALSPNQIADRLITSRATVTGLLDSLERRGYVRRAPHPSDRRSLVVNITASGRQAVAAFRPIVHAHQKEWFEVLSGKEQERLLATLRRLQTALSKTED